MLSQKMTFFFLFVSLFLPVFSPLSGWSEEPEYRYVADEFRITMRRGPAASFKVVRMLSTGMKLTLLEKGSEGWDRVQTQRGEEGWVLRRFIRSEAPARVRIVEMERALEQASSERDILQEQLLVANQKLLGQEEMAQELDQIRAISGQAVNLVEENQSLVTKLEEIEKKFAEVSLMNEKLTKQADTRFFLAGAAVLILGVIIGAILFRRRRPSYDTL
ncbi:MAG: TIGR04211 family SH3 domain-containing protein [Magnetococcales bacterium]|nr:TIGR04211 family SH3 domain-containing protein [Magnetococcales bacterium]